MNPNTKKKLRAIGEKMKTVNNIQEWLRLRDEARKIKASSLRKCIDETV